MSNVAGRGLAFLCARRLQFQISVLGSASLRFLVVIRSLHADPGLRDALKRAVVASFQYFPFSPQASDLSVLWETSRM